MVKMLNLMTFRNIGDEVHMAEKQLLEFAEIHVSKGTKYKNAADRI